MQVFAGPASGLYLTDPQTHSFVSGIHRTLTRIDRIYETNKKNLRSCSVSFPHGGVTLEFRAPWRKDDRSTQCGK